MILTSPEERKKDRETIEKRRRTAHAAKKFACNWCDLTGMTTAFDRQTGLAYSFRCISCDAAEKLCIAQTIPQWSTSLAGRFDLFPLNGEQIPEERRKYEPQSTLDDALSGVDF